MMIEFIIALIGGVFLGFSIANVALIITLKNNVTVGDSKVDFETFSKQPIRMLSDIKDKSVGF